MRLYEFEDNNTLAMRLTGIISQVHSRIKDTGYNKNYSVDSLLSILSDRGINLNSDDLRDMIQDEPLSNLIADIKGDRVIFKGEYGDNSATEMPDKSSSTLEKMAKRASKD